MKIYTVRLDNKPKVSQINGSIVLEAPNNDCQVLDITENWTEKIATIEPNNIVILIGTDKFEQCTELMTNEHDYRIISVLRAAQAGVMEINSELIIGYHEGTKIDSITSHVYRKVAEMRKQFVEGESLSDNFTN